MREINAKCIQTPKHQKNILSTFTHFRRQIDPIPNVNKYLIFFLIQQYLEYIPDITLINFLDLMNLAYDMTVYWASLLLLCSFSFGIEIRSVEQITPLSLPRSHSPFSESILLTMASLRFVYPSTGTPPFPSCS